MPDDTDANAAVALEQERIARALHDSIIQQLFDVSYGLHGVASLGGTVEQRALIKRTIAQLDDAITDIRSIVFDLDGRLRLVEGRRSHG